MHHFFPKDPGGKQGCGARTITSQLSFDKYFAISEIRDELPDLSGGKCCETTSILNVPSDLS
ncbi:hypothetical protein Mpsy_0531 [Methanolobus psychrophilus R15]|nr:hypothetical protein Mpsy_0531 [Methanolobus psychrophilus R15]